MEVHHHSHTPRKKFGHYFWEFFMLFLAVIAGFLVENQREHYIEHKRAKDYAVMFKTDLQQDTAILQNYIDTRQAKVHMNSQASELFYKNTNEITIGQLRKRRELTIQLNSFVPHDGTLTQMKNSGTLRYFTDKELLTNIANYEFEIRKYIDMKNELKAIYGGLASDHILRFDIELGRFLSKTEHFDSTAIAAKNGYSFASWNEKNAIAENFMFLEEMLITSIYPTLKNAATRILKILNEEYHLE